MILRVILLALFILGIYLLFRNKKKPDMIELKKCEKCGNFVHEDDLHTVDKKLVCKDCR